MRPLLLGLCLVLLVGCSPQRPGPQGRLGVPADGYVRIITTRVTDTPQKKHYQWTILGDRNWTTPTLDSKTAHLAGVYALNDPKHSGGCHTWMVNAIITPNGSGSKVELSLHGSNGATAKTELGGLTAEPKLLVAEDRDLRLPAQIELLQLGGDSLTLSLPDR